MKKALRELLIKTGALGFMLWVIFIGIQFQIDPKLLIVCEAIGRVVGGLIFLFLIVIICIGLGNYEKEEKWYE